MKHSCEQEDEVEMTKKSFKDEHHRLIKILRKGNRGKLIKEAAAQARELRSKK